MEVRFIASQQYEEEIRSTRTCGLVFIRAERAADDLISVTLGTPDELAAEREKAATGARSPGGRA